MAKKKGDKRTIASSIGTLGLGLGAVHSKRKSTRAYRTSNFEQGQAEYWRYRRNQASQEAKIARHKIRQSTRVYKGKVPGSVSGDPYNLYIKDVFKNKLKYYGPRASDTHKAYKTAQEQVKSFEKLGKKLQRRSLKLGVAGLGLGAYALYRSRKSKKGK